MHSSDWRRGRPPVRWWLPVLVVAIVIAGLGLGLGLARTGQDSPAVLVPHRTPPVSEAGIHKIKHVVIIMQENRSFDSFFGTYPGADGIPAKNGHFTVCVPDPRRHRCDRPYHDPSLVNGGAGHSREDAIDDVDGGKMDGFVRVAELSLSRGCALVPP